MKSLNLIESRNIDNDVAETLLPTLSNKKMNEITGGLVFDKDKPLCVTYSIQPCYMRIDCNKYINGSTLCRDHYTLITDMDNSFQGTPQTF